MSEMTEVKSGGPAFPGIGDGSFTGSFIPFGGLSKREWFAGMALTGALASGQVNFRNTKDIPRACFDYADAMLKESTQGEEGK